MSNLLIGADPEFFVTKDGNFVSAYGLIEGTKKNPLKVKDGAVQVDGMALEFNINPASTFEEFEHNVQSVLSDLRAMVPKEYEFAFVPVADFGSEYIKNQPEEARILGCDPDFNAYTGKANNPPNAEKPFRTASGHLHYGWTKDEDIQNPEHIEACQMFTIQLDATLGMRSVLFDPDNRRRELYGKAGAYRPKHYGVEYRVLSNFWLNDKDIRQELFDAGVKAYNHLVDGKSYERILGNQVARVTINENRSRWAYEYLGYFGERTALINRHYQAWLTKENLRKDEAKKKKAAALGEKVKNPLPIPEAVVFDNRPVRRPARNELGQFIRVDNVAPAGLRPLQADVDNFWDNVILNNARRREEERLIALDRAAEVAG